MDTKFRILVDSFFPYKISASDIDITSIEQCEVRAKWRRFLPHFINLFFSSFQYDIIMTARKDGKFLGLLYYFFKPTYLKHIIYEFIFENKSSLRGKASWFIWKIIMRKIDRVLVQSTAEVLWYSKVFGVNMKKFVFVPVAVPTGMGFVGPSDGGYIFSAGRTNRDYKTLLNALINLKVQCVIVASSREKIFFDNLPGYIKIYFDVTKDEYYTLLSRCKLVVLALKEGYSSRGQIVVLEAMALGKPVVCTDIPVVRDYIEDGISGILTSPNSVDALREKIVIFLKNEAMLQKISKEGYNRVKKFFNYDKFIHNFGVAVKDAMDN